MIKKVLIFLTFLLFIGPLIFGQTEQKPPAAWVNFLEGTTGTIQGSAGSETLTLNLIVQEGDKITTNKKSFVEIAFGKGNYLRIWKNSEVEFVALEKEVSLDISGDAYLRVENLAKEFTVNYDGSTSKISEVGLYRFSKEKNQNFEKINEKREEELKPAAEEESRLPEELREHESTLNRHGKWVYIEDDWCWVPTVVTTDWRPFSLGYWGWYPIWGYTWISYEPWGWLTYHYGGWYWDYYYDWYWRPGLFWSPAWVYWYYGYDYYYGWAPWGYRDCPRDKAWSFIRKDQLKKRNSQDPQHVSQILRKDQLKNLNINSGQISQTGPSRSSIEGKRLSISSPEKITQQGITPQGRARYFPQRITSQNTIRKESSPKEIKMYPSRFGRETISQQRGRYYPTESRRITRGENRTPWRSFFDRPSSTISSGSSSKSISKRGSSKVSSGSTRSGSISRSSAPTRSSGSARSGSGASSGRVRKK